MRWRPRFTWDGGAGVLELALPVAEWREREQSVGGALEAGSGTIAGYVVRRDRILELPLRIGEGEWPGVLAMLRAAQAGAVLTYFPDADDVGTSIACTLLAPLADGQAQPEPEGEYQRVARLPISLRRADGLAWDLDQWGVPG